MEEETLPTALSLSDLPENVIDEILCRLPIKDAVATGILSRFWHRRWESISCLDFSDNGYGENPYKIANIVVSHVLLLHSGPIRLFKADVKENDSFAVHGWLVSLSSRAASTLLTLRLLFAHNDPLLSILRSFPCLTHLQLSYCNYMTVGLDNYFFSSRFTTALRTLQLSCCPLSGKFSLLISACPLLETLILRCITEVGLEDTHSEIVAPNLRRLEIKWVAYNTADFFIMTAPILETAVIDFCAPSDVTVASTNCNLIKFLAGMPCIRMLELSLGTLEFLGGGHIRETIPICLNQLRFMSLTVNFGDTRQVLTTFCLLRCVPNLQKLEFTGYRHAGEVPGHGQNFWTTLDREGLFDKLESVTIIMINCEEAEFDFIQLVLAEAQILKLMTINLCKHFVLKKVKKKLLKFPIISGQAQIQIQIQIAGALSEDVRRTAVLPFVGARPLTYRKYELADATDTEEGGSEDSFGE